MVWYVESFDDDDDESKTTKTKREGSPMIMDAFHEKNRNPFPFRTKRDANRYDGNGYIRKGML